MGEGGVKARRGQRRDGRAVRRVVSRRCFERAGVWARAREGKGKGKDKDGAWRSSRRRRYFERTGVRERAG